MSIWEVNPRDGSVGCFQLGMSMYEARMRIEQNPDFSSCDIVYHDKYPFSLPITFFLRKENILLEFDSISHVLVKITLKDLVNLSFTYNRLPFVPFITTLHYSFRKTFWKKSGVIVLLCS